MWSFSSITHYWILKPLLLNLWNFFNKFFDLILFSLQLGIWMKMEAFVISSKTGGIIKLSSLSSLSFWYWLITLLMKGSAWSTFITFFHQRDFYIKVLENSFWTMKTEFDYFSILAFRNFKCLWWICGHHWCWVVYYESI